ncbi:CSTB [Bugula neritina]|uniref:CSTB n=1 Tax=Bugula neritina TaxID=10212 RepID=A0A7J7KS62_BUGNE|nr:CSTB [Bugula neritina]
MARKFSALQSAAVIVFLSLSLSLRVSQSVSIKLSEFQIKSDLEAVRLKRMSQLVGGPSGVKEADAEIQDILDKTRTGFEDKAGVKFDEFTAISYRSQVVAGTNYFIKVKVGTDKYVHVKVFKSLPHAGGTLKVENIQLNKSLDDDISNF